MIVHIPRQDVINLYFENGDIKKIRLDQFIDGDLFTGEQRSQNRFFVGLGDGRDAIFYPSNKLIIPEVSLDAFERWDKNPYDLSYYLSDDKLHIPHRLQLIHNLNGSYPFAYEVVYNELRGI